MITGFNSDIEHGGKVFHVQTEEKGVDNPVVITLVYCGGEIVTSHEASYADLVNEESVPESEIRRRMSEQHQGLICDIRRGRFTSPRMPFGHDLISDRSLDELVLGYLEESIAEVEATSAVEQAESVDRTVKVDRVLNRLERFLSAAQRAQIEQETHAASVVVEAPEEIAETTDEAREAASIDADVSGPTGGRERRTPRWIWAAAAAAMIVAAVGLFTLQDSGGSATDPPAEVAPVVPVAPASESAETAAEEMADLRAGVSPVPLPAVDPVAETTADDDAAPDPAAVALPSTAVLPRAEDPVAVVRQTPDPVATPAAGTTIAEDDPPATPEDTTATSIPSESATPPAENDPFAALDDVDLRPKARQRDLPRYTRRARRLQQEGIVQLRIRIDSHGAVAEVILLQGIPDSDLNEAAVEVARDWTFSPARKDGRRVQVWKDVAFEFTVRPDRTTSVRIRE